MSFQTMLDHTCNIYHVIEEEESPGYALPSSPAFHYPEEPDEVGVACHFAVHASNITFTQTAPADLIDAYHKLTLPTGTDIRRHDKVVHVETGLEYTAEQPRNIRGHHLFVLVKKKEGQRTL